MRHRRRASPRLSTILLGGARIVEDDGLYRPRPRPDPRDVLGWLDGRALGQFAPGQHVWVQNQLPASVFLKKQQKCLAEGIYFEARGEPEEGQAAVAQVILNRVRNPAYPKTICGVVYQNKRHRNRCQFSFACDGRSEVIAERASGTRRSASPPTSPTAASGSPRSATPPTITPAMSVLAGAPHDQGRPHRRAHLLPHQIRRLVVTTASRNPLPKGARERAGEGCDGRPLARSSTPHSLIRLLCSHLLPLGEGR